MTHQEVIDIILRKIPGEPKEDERLLDGLRKAGLKE